MIVIKNTGDEAMELVTHIDVEVPGCRVVKPAPGPNPMPPGEEICILAYEPGVSYSIQPLDNRDVPRNLT